MNWTAAWICWLVFIGLSFLMIETKSAKDNGQLSVQAWHLIGIGEQPSLGVRLRRISFTVIWFAAWILLTIHFYGGGNFI